MSSRLIIIVYICVVCALISLMARCTVLTSTICVAGSRPWRSCQANGADRKGPTERGRPKWANRTGPTERGRPNGANRTGPTERGQPNGATGMGPIGRTGPTEHHTVGGRRSFSPNPVKTCRWKIRDPGIRGAAGVTVMCPPGPAIEGSVVGQCSSRRRSTQHTQDIV